MAAIEVSPKLRIAAQYLGESGQRWLDDLPGLVAELEAEWGIVCGRALTGGNFGYVAEAVTTDGEAAALKVALPPKSDGLKQELRALHLAHGDPYVRLIRFDVERRALLLERLGRPLGELGWPVDRQIRESVSTVARGWQPVAADGDELETGAAKAKWLAEFIPTTWQKLGRPCSEQAVERAVRYANERELALDGQRLVLVHGDAHPWNILEVAGDDRAEKRFRLIDPEGLASEPAHELGVILRGWNEELLEADTTAVALERCASVARQTGVDREATWQWSYIERVSSGLFMLDLGLGDQCRPYLEVADRLSGVEA